MCRRKNDDNPLEFRRFSPKLSEKPGHHIMVSMINDNQLSDDNRDDIVRTTDTYPNISSLSIIHPICPIDLPCFS